jgi:hypothetical protein
MNGSRFVAAISIAMLTGCSSHLSRSKVDSEMRQQYQCPHSACFPGFGGQELLLTIGKVTGSCHGVTDYDPVQSDYRREYKALAQAGYITIKPEKRHVWNVSLTQAGRQAIKDAPYAHTQKGDCDSWQVTLPLSTFEDLIVSGVLEDGAHAKADISVKWKVTPLGLALRKEAAQLKLSDLGTQVLVGDDLARLAVNATEYRTYRTNPI